MTAAAFLAFADAPGASVRLHILLAGVQTGSLAMLADAIEVTVVALYLLGVRRVARRGRRWSPWHTAAFISGVGVMWVAVGSGLAAYDDVNVTMHVVQHVLLMMVAPPLVTLGKPVTLAMQAVTRTVQVRLVRFVHTPLVAALSFPVLVWILYYGTMYVFFLTGVYPYAVAHPLFHDGTHLWSFIVGFLYWQPLVGLDPTHSTWPRSIKLGSLFIGMSFEAFLGISVAESAQPLAPINTLANTQQAGNAFWILSSTLSVMALAAVVVQWYRQLERETVREDRRAATLAAESRARAEDLGLEVPSGVTVPWWRIEELEAQQEAVHRARPE